MIFGERHYDSMRLVFRINIEVLGKNFVIALWIIYNFVLSSNLSKVSLFI